MPLPSQATLLKIHPAIGIARVSSNPDFFVFGTRPATYKSNGSIKRQAVQFSLAAYDAAGQRIDTYTVAQLQTLGMTVVWRVSLANKKIARLRGNARSIAGADQRYAILAKGQSNQNGGILTGGMQATDYEEGHAVPLGEIRPDGLFIPGQGSVYKARSGDPVPDASMFSPDLTDNTCDGTVEVDLLDRQTGQPVGLRVLPAWLIVAPPDFSPDLTDSDLFPTRSNLSGWLAGKLNAPQPVNNTAAAIDRDVLRQGTDDFNPGIESNLGSAGFQHEHNNNIAPLFLAVQDTLDASEMRVDPAKVEPGDLTGYLCSPWQYDFRPCSCGFWAAQRPDMAFRDDTANLTWSPTGDRRVEWLRLVARSTGRPPAGGRLFQNLDFVEHTQELGIIRRRNGENIETERTNDITGVAEV